MEALILITDIVEKAVLLLLLGLSIWSVTIMFDRRRFLKKQLSQDSFLKTKEKIQSQKLANFQNSNENFYDAIFTSVKNNVGPAANSEQIDRAVSSYIKEERPKLEKGLTVLATLGANAPFIGLFGTVLGIIRSFAYLGSQSGSAAVMSGVSQALYATAMGLFVAIPAVVAYNIFSNQVKKSVSKAEALRDLLITKLNPTS